MLRPMLLKSSVAVGKKKKLRAMGMAQIVEGCKWEALGGRYIIPESNQFSFKNKINYRYLRNR
jgi:hypothetical protein